MKSLNKTLVCLIIIILVFTPIIVKNTQAAPPPSQKTYTITIESDYSVYVSQEQPTKNYNSDTNLYYLNIQQDEFTYQCVSFVKFDLSELPEDAEILDAEISLYLIDVPQTQGTVKMYPIREVWYENSVTWNTKPTYKDFSKTQGLIDSITISTAGWKEWDATTVVEEWVDGSRTNYGVAFETSTNLPRFRSDESSFEPELYILYQTMSGEEPEEPPEESPEDTTPCEITYTITPESPQSGDTVILTAIATDDIGLEYLTIKEGSIERCSSFAEDDETTELTCEYTEILFTPGKTFFIEANDKGSSTPQLLTVDITVEGTGSNPEVTLDISYDGEDAIPDNYRLLPMDGQRVDITVTATDPDGIDFLTITCDGMPYDYSYDPPETEVEETITLINGVDILDDCTIPCTFRYYARAYDTEGRSTRVDGDDIEIAAPWQWYWGLPFANWGCDENHTWSWTMMESIFGDEIWWNKERGWKKPHAEYLYDNKIKEGGRGGHCYGMCALALELAQPSSDIYANLIQPTAVSIDDLERENWNNTWRYYYARQASQYSRECCALETVQWLLQPERSGSGLHPFIEDILNQIIDDLNDGSPGIISIFEGSKGHAVVPWRVVPLGGDQYNVYIYDPNHNYTSTHDSIDYENFNHYPYIVFGEDGWSRDGWWSYQWNSSSTWNENIYYTPYEIVIGNPSSKNYIGTSPTIVEITDQRLPDPLQTLVHGSGDASFYAEDSHGRKTGYVNGSLFTEIPYSTPLYESMGEDGRIDMFILPQNVTLTFHVESDIESTNENGSYSLMLWQNSSLYMIEDVPCVKGTTDEIIFTPRMNNENILNHAVTFRRGDVIKLRASDPSDQTDNAGYTISFVKEFFNSPTRIGRQYTYTSYQYDENTEVELYISDDFDDLVIESYNAPLNFTIETKSTESLDEHPDLDYIPTTIETFSMDANDKMVLTPTDWATASAAGSFTSDENGHTTDTPQTPGFVLVMMLIAIIIGIIWKKK